MRLPLALLIALVPVSLACCGEVEPAEPVPAGARSAAPQQPTTVPSPRPARPEWKPSDDPKLAKFMGYVAPKPAIWIEHPPSSGLGRVANYTVPGRDGNEAAHINVFFFGPDQGGDVDSNIDRWQSQFRPDPDGALQEPIVERLEVDGMPVTLVELAGDWMKMGQTWYTSDQLFVAAIAEAPEGKIFIRFAGQTATVEANRPAFIRMIEGLSRGEPPI